MEMLFTKKKRLATPFLYGLIVVFNIALLFSCGNKQENTGNTNGANTQENFAVQDSMILNDSLFASDTVFVEQAAVPKKKMNKKNLVVKEWNTDVRTNVRVLDHVTTYNAKGQKIEEIEYNSEGQKWRERYDFDANGKKVRELIYDGHNNLVQAKKYQYNEYGKKTITYTYNAQGKLIAIKNYEYLTQE